MNARRTLALAITLGVATLSATAPAYAVDPTTTPTASATETATTEPTATTAPTAPTATDTPAPDSTTSSAPAEPSMTAAAADDTVQIAAAPGMNPALIDASKPTALDIHKYLGTPTTLPHDGTAQTGITLPPLQGVVFDVYQVAGVDLTTNEGWAAATDLQGVTLTQEAIKNLSITGKSGKTYALTLKQSVTTDATGNAVYNTGGVGLFLVNENLTSSTTIVNTATNEPVDPKTVTPAAPFLVTLPMTNPAGTEWMYTVNVYPKNSSDSMTKEVVDMGTVTTADGAVVTGDSEITYKLSGTVSALPADQIGTYYFVDTLPTGTTYKSVTNVKVGTTTLTETTDYTVTVEGQKVTIKLTPAGIEKMAAVAATDPTAKVTAEINATATLDAGLLENTAYVVPNNTFEQNQTNIPSNTVITKYGKALLTKVDAANPTTKLSGAVFDLYATIYAGTLASPKPTECTNVVGDQSKRVMTGITTGADGTVSIDGLQQSDFYDNVQQPATGGQYILYCLVETKAPQGYNLNAQPTAFYVTDYTKVLAVEVKDEKTNLENSLPLTGGAGAGFLSVAGLLVVGGTLGARAISRKRREESELA